MAEDGTLAQVGEFGLIARMLSTRADSAKTTDAPESADPAGSTVLVGPGDDCAVVQIAGAPVAITVDVLVEGRHFRRDWSTPLEIGRKAAAASLADIASMGAVPTAVVVGFGAPGDTPVNWALAVSAAISEECAFVGAQVVGGDVTASESVVISITALGDFQGRQPVLRSGAQIGDVVAIAGRLGWSAAGLAVLSRGFRSPKALVDAHRVPEPPYGSGPAAAIAGATSMIDVSDGLVADARHVGTASGVVLALESKRLTVPEELMGAAAAYNIDARTWMFTGGEDHALLATFPQGTVLPEGFVVIGEVLAGEPGVMVDGAPVAAAGGHEHFR